MKAKLSILFSVPYFILAILVISVKLLGMPEFENIIKPLLLLTLMLWFGIDQKVNGIKINWIFVFALFFSMLGDVFLMPLFDHFILGLVFFLVSHLLYIFVFLNGNRNRIRSSFRQGIVFVVVVISVYVGLLLFLMPAVVKLNSVVLLVAVPLYATVLLVMVLSAIVYAKVYFYNFGRYVMLGGLLFLVSDGVLAINKFAAEISYSTIWIMGTYTLAQWMLVYGYMNSKKEM